MQCAGYPPGPVGTRNLDIPPLLEKRQSRQIVRQMQYGVACVADTEENNAAVLIGETPEGGTGTVGAVGQLAVVPGEKP
jgi:hypothetical protein